MPLLVVDIDRIENDDNCWCAVAPAEGEDWVDYLAKRYRELRTESVVRINDIVLDGVTFLSKDAIQKHLTNALVPQKGSGIFRVERSDFGETISYCFLEDQYGTRFGYKSIRDRELIQFTGRGIDAIGVECHDQEPICLVLGETKTSAEHRSPPQVVDSAQDSLRAQHMRHLSDQDDTLGKVWNAARHARDKETQQLLFTAALYLQDERWDKLRIVAFSCLVRPHSLYETTDYGSFRKKPTDFYPGKIRFAAFCVPSDDIETLIDGWLEIAQGSEVEQ